MTGRAVRARVLRSELDEMAKYLVGASRSAHVRWNLMDPRHYRYIQSISSEDRTGYVLVHCDALLIHCETLDSSHAWDETSVAK